ncbi:aminotransferase-like domain-containing protein [Auraticoccus monumenti]|uniref:DNA-binding transcriptional regulator, MocR family, contains an aminotransferase domain n=1 Tax=Auraticoccus monumenti TaxID=675864 RepID=A0A1G6S009_9ACTN|nr:PLP-dependent aminotransferase family protein [Auraticoccus monumenti]SDD10013.1 DNA-binding transcriptional regulator, MocR family, contains an aminotransferase domain [Auraticoccus monumenti]
MWHPGDLDPADGTRTEQVAALISRRIERGDLAIGSRLPGERALAERLGVSRVTVVRALDLLRGEGALSTRHGAGSQVLPLDRWADPVAPLSTVQRSADAATGGDGWPLIDLRHATTAAPHEVAAAVARLQQGALAEAMTGDGPPRGGSLVLRERLADRLTADGTATDPAQLTLTTGAASALEALVAGVDHASGTVLTETPTYPAALDIFRRHGLEVVGWPAGAHGWDVDQLAHLCRRHRPGLVYLQADNHNPTGLSLPTDRRAPVVAEVLRAGALLVSDETLRPLWLQDTPQAAPLSAHPKVVGIGSLSKTVWGGLRVGWIRSSRLQRRRVLESAPPGLLSPGAVDELLAGELMGLAGQVTERRRGLLRANLAGLEEALATLPDVAWTTPTGGMTLWLELLADRPRQLVARARRAGLLLSHAELFTPDQASRQHLRIPFTAQRDTLAGAVARLAELMGGPGR